MENTEQQLIKRSSRKSRLFFICNKCKKGRMEPLSNEGEPEYTDLFVCNQCNQQATIPSMVIICSQLVSALLGGSLSLYLFIQHLYKVLTAFQLNTTSQITLNLTLMAIAAFFILGFGYTFYRALIGITRRRKYQLSK